MGADAVSLADGFHEIRRRWPWLVVAAVLGLSATLLLGSARSSTQWEATARLRLVDQRGWLESVGLSAQSAPHRDAKGEAAYLTDSAVSDLLGGTSAATFTATPGADGLLVVIVAHAATATAAHDGAEQLRTKYIDRLGAADNEQFDAAAAAVKVRVDSFDTLIAKGDPPSEVLVAREAAVAELTALKSLPRDGKFSATAVGPVTSPVEVGSGKATKKQLVLGALVGVTLAAFAAGVQGLRRPRVHSAADVGAEWQSRVLPLPNDASNAEVRLMGRVLAADGRAVAVVVIAGAEQLPPLEVAAKVDVVPDTELAGIEPGVAAVVAVRYGVSTRARLRRVLHELHLMHIEPSLIVFTGVPRRAIDDVTPTPLGATS